MAQKSTRKGNGGVMIILGATVVIIFLGVLYAINFSNLFSVEYGEANISSTTPLQALLDKVKPTPVLDKEAYDRKLLSIANNASTTASTTKTLWPAPTKVYPKGGAILPFKRIVAYYGNFYSKGMGVLGEYPKEIMLDKLNTEVKRWSEADPDTPVLPAIDYIVTTAQESAGVDGKYRLRMPDSEIDHALDLAHEVNGIVILDVQVGLSNLQKELPVLQKYLKLPEVHLAIDPEFSMKTGARPGTVIGSMDAEDINFAINFLAKIVQENDLPPKVLVVHRFTKDMVTNYKNIVLLPEVQIVMDMDGWGFAAKKLNTYAQVIHPEPVQFTGFKLFYKNDLKPPSTRMLTPEELLKLSPQPVFIQFQ